MLEQNNKIKVIEEFKEMNKDYTIELNLLEDIFSKINSQTDPAKSEAICKIQQQAKNINFLSKIDRKLGRDKYIPSKYAENFTIVREELKKLINTIQRKQETTNVEADEMTYCLFTFWAVFALLAFNALTFNLAGVSAVATISLLAGNRINGCFRIRERKKHDCFEEIKSIL